MAFNQPSYLISEHLYKTRPAVNNIIILLRQILMVMRIYGIIVIIGVIMTIIHRAYGTRSDFIRDDLPDVEKQRR